ncbi:branched-chain amino acid ABC transporter permease [Roseovarius indicus]|uniref:Branched-chain amino acid ABC transporter permease n=1 Tax=Roseovarius indicus TaxID=540747 RepID=A0A0T5PDW2_9RHOB|nr:branched-chain amino acid ABC transporter permease [Roseovarius indicus]KRS19226.1 branched-chain amino acid ABC transporter permease [Roseovarius indicus]QEW25803.1 LIV-I protein H [Roseovarius indicus]SFD88654.1 amino acid/amide ABC transporter membrane protein 1, HAAT family [Roseovarius indicus]
MQLVFQLLVSGVLLGGVYALAALGLNLIFGVAKIVNFAHGEFLMLGMYAGFGLMTLTGINPYWGSPLIAVAFFVLGMAFYWCVMRFTIYSTELTQVFTTLGLSIALQNLALVLFSADYRTIQTMPEGMSSLQVMGFHLSTDRVIAFFFALAIFGGVMFFLRRTYTGRAIEAVSQDLTAARLMGINTRKIFLITFGLGIGITGVAGAVLVPSFYAFPSVGTFFVLIAFVVVILGGLGSVTGTMIGGLSLGLIESYIGYFSPDLKEATHFILLILLLAVRPQGMLGVKGAEKETLK